MMAVAPHKEQTPNTAFEALKLLALNLKKTGVPRTVTILINRTVGPLGRRIQSFTDQLLWHCPKKAQGATKLDELDTTTQKKKEETNMEKKEKNNPPPRGIEPRPRA